MVKKIAYLFIVLCLILFSIPSVHSNFDASEKLINQKVIRYEACVLTNEIFDVTIQKNKQFDFPKITNLLLITLKRAMSFVNMNSYFLDEILNSKFNYLTYGDIRCNEEKQFILKDLTKNNSNRNLQNCQIFNQILLLKFNNDCEYFLSQLQNVIKKHCFVLDVEYFYDKPKHSAVPNQNYIYMCENKNQTIFDPYTQNWGLLKTRIHDASFIANLGVGVNVAVMEDGILPHNNFKDRLVNLNVPHNSFLQNTFSNSHPVQVAGIIGDMVWGGASQANLFSLYWGRSCKNAQSLHTYQISLNFISSLILARQNNINVINASFSFLNPNQYNRWEYQSTTASLNAMLNFQRNGVFVVAAGNQGRGIIYGQYPQSYALKPGVNGVIVVGASTMYDQKWTHSNYSSTEVCLFAPGHHILTTTWPFGYTIVSGTSFAAPHVAATAALIFNLRPWYNGFRVRNAILRSVDQVPGLYKYSISGGRLNAFNAIIGL